MTTFFTESPESTVAARVHRVEVHPIAGEPDAMAHRYLDAAREAFGQSATLHTARVYLIEAPLSDEDAQRIANELLADPVNQQAVLGIRSRAAGNAASAGDEANSTTVEVHYQPGVMDPVAQSARDAILEMLPALSADQLEVRTGWRFDLDGGAFDEAGVRRFAEQALANPVIQDIHVESYHPDAFVHGSPYALHLTHVPIRDLDHDGLRVLSREGHLFLSLDEMQAIQNYYREAQREPTDIELETLAQTWSEHCVHKTLKATIRYTESGERKAEIDFAQRPGHTVNDDGSITINNLLKSTIAAATNELMSEAPHDEWCISVFVDNAGIVKFDDEDAICIKVETHNHPSAIEPYGGAATGIGGCIRDVMGTGLSAKPIANTDVFCVAWRDEGQGPGARGQAEKDNSTDDGNHGPRPSTYGPLPKGVIDPKRILQQVVAGVRDYGNRMGIPTINGAVWFHDDYLGNPLVYCGCIGMMPLDKCFGDAQPGDRIIALGGRTGRDGIHGATFSSAELTDTHADEFSHAVQIGNAITQKKTMDVILRARDAEGGPLYSAITDCGAGGFSSAVGEMGEKVGACVQLDQAPLKYDGLSYTEIWISEAQERMVLAVPQENVDTIRAMCEAEDVEMCDLGQFGWNSDGPEGNDPTLVLKYHDTEVGRLSMHLLHDGIPMPTREAVWGSGKGHGGTEARRHEGQGNQRGTGNETLRASVPSCLRALLSHPNIASKHWIIKQYDHEVQGGSVIKPLTGPGQDGPSDASVVRPKLGSDRGVAVGCGLAPHLSEKATESGWADDGDSYWATLAAIDEAVRNVVCAGADPSRIAILDNFCWPSCDDPKQLGSLVRAAEACYDGAMAYRTPFVSGKDSLNNQFTTEDGQVITIPQTLLITAMGIVPDANKCRTMDAKQAGNVLLIVGETTGAVGGSHLQQIRNPKSEIRNLCIPHVNLKAGPARAKAIAQLLTAGHIASIHDCSDGGFLVAAAEMAFAGRIGLDIDLGGLPTATTLDPIAACFAETPSRYLLEVSPDKLDATVRSLREANIPFGQVGTFADHDQLTVRTPDQGNIMAESLDELRDAWRKPLDW